ncbi:hypothetical protein GCM10011309_12740 [Litorimonas cladophorae]|uniref:DUF2141 domain-containing protein n=1 Tax=Litorimonas cladophorae TaxID=1220491 RepID=A0A918KK87_9PROT|nr:DUF2141 domain-containing protein [Litorimonas cladophorae]GGX64133.1 hypothetical protein GCM10011309_12740 [Litorimonas cladophorae]
MFVTLKKTTTTQGFKMVSLAGMMTLVSAMTSVAADTPAWKHQPGDIPVIVKLMDVVPADQLAGEVGGPIYVSIQKREDYQSMKGFGGIIKTPVAGEMTATFHVDAPGDYSVSIWHDRDDDGRFSMDASYNVLDSWGASGTPPPNAAPTFDDVKITVPNMGADVTIKMINPS